MVRKLGCAIIFSESPKVGFAYVRKVLVVTAPVFIIVALVLCFLGRDILHYIYNGYSINNSMAWGAGVSIAILPVLFMLENVLAVKKIDDLMSLIVIGWCDAGWGLALLNKLLESSFPLMIFGVSLTMLITFNKKEW